MRTTLIAAALTVAAVSRADAAALPQPGAASAQTLKLPTGPGSVRGLATDPTVSTFTGELAYQVPIELPAGPGRLTPELALRYLGGLGNGPLGVGWQLQLPVIHRSTRLGVPRYDDSDELELGGVARGGRLVKLTDGSYRVMGQGQFVKVVASGKGWKAYDGDGRIYDFASATTSGARQESGSKIAAWYPDSITDVAGQTIAFTYKKVDGQLYLTSIVWGPAQIFKVVLVYENRPDPLISYRTGFRVRTGERLDELRVQVKKDGAYQARSTYVTGYDDSLPLSRLAQLTQLGRDGITAMPPLRFAYAQREAAQAFELAGTGGWVLGQAGVSLLDVDGDGVGDLLKTWNGVHAWRRNRGGNFASERSLASGQTWDLDSARIMDLDGDARPELVRIASGQWSGQKLRGETWDPSFVWPGTSGLPLQDASGATSWIDIDGDSRIDVVAPSGAGLGYYKNGAGGYAAKQSLGAISSSQPSVVPGQPGVRFFEVNGDGLEDVLWLAPSGVQVFLGKGDATFEERPMVAYPWNGTVDLPNLHLADMNRDGLVDLVRVVGSEVELYHGRGEGFDTTARRVAQPATNVLGVALADANGNGSQDLVWCTATRMYAIDLAGTTEAGMLASIDNGLGKTIGVAYEASGVLAMRDELINQAWVQKLPASIPVVIRTEQSPGAGEPVRATDYAVRDAFWDAGERRFGGYLQGTTTIDPGGPHEQRETVRYHGGLNSSRVLRGKLLTRRVEVGNQVILEITHDWKTRPLTGLTAAVPAHAPLLYVAVEEKTGEKRFEGRVDPISSLIERDFDAEGREKEVRDLGRSDLGGDEIVTRRTWASSDSPWVRDRVYLESVHQLDGTMVSEKQTLYGDSTSILPLGQIGRGWLRVEKHHLVYALSSPPTDRWVNVATRTYDTLGNVTGGLDEGVLRKIELDGKNLFPLREIVAPAVGKQLVYAQTWDEVLGQPDSHTSPDGTVVVLGRDALGRLTSMAYGSASPHIHHDYAWSGPRPQITTWTFSGPEDEVTARPTTWSPTGAWRKHVTAIDGAGDPVLRATQLGATRWVVDEMRERNAIGKTSARARPFYFDGAAPPTAIPDGAPRELVLYDALGRPKEQITPTGHRRRTTYGAYTRAVSVDGQATLTSTFDGQDRIVRTQRTVDGKLESADAGFDPADRITTLSLADGAALHRYTYDTLGRLRRTEDPDLGLRRLEYDDGGRVTQAKNALEQSLTLAYDGAGRLKDALTSEGGHFVYRYDEAHPDLPASRVVGRLGWVEEPAGYTAVGYGLGGQQTRLRRRVLGQTLESTMRYAPTGALLSQRYDDGLEVSHGYDPAGRLISVGDYWQATELEADGKVKVEQFGNGALAAFARDSAGLLSGLTLTSGGQLRLNLAITRKPFGAIDTVTDGDGVGLAHTSDFEYDEGGRLAWAKLGSGAGAFEFAYAYDRLDNMTGREAIGPRPLGILSGTYHYGENGAGPRQLTSVDGTVDASFVHDAAGRQIQGRGATLGFDALDQLVRVEGLGTGTITYGYGYDAQRTWSSGPGGTRVWFSPSVTQANGVRDYYVTVEDRVVARITRAAAAPAAPAAAVKAALIVASLGLLAFLLLGRPRPRLRLAGALTVTAQLASCAGQAAFENRSATSSGTVHYLHTGIAAGPALITRADGSVVEERRFEPFGAPIEADLGFEPHNSLGKPADPTTGWSYHGARWMAPETGRWLSADPLVKAPDAMFLAMPWRLNPYSYADSNPISFWDPDGKQAVPWAGGGFGNGKGPKLDGDRQLKLDIPHRDFGKLKVPKVPEVKLEVRSEGQAGGNIVGIDWSVSVDKQGGVDIGLGRAGGTVKFHLEWQGDLVAKEAALSTLHLLNDTTAQLGIVLNKPWVSALGPLFTAATFVGIKLGEGAARSVEHQIPAHKPGEYWEPRTNAFGGKR